MKILRLRVGVIILSFCLFPLSLQLDLWASPNEGLQVIKQAQRLDLVHSLLGLAFESNPQHVYLDGTDIGTKAVPALRGVEFSLLSPVEREKLDVENKIYWRMLAEEKGRDQFEICLASGTGCGFSGLTYKCELKKGKWNIQKLSECGLGCGEGIGPGNGIGSAH